MAILGELVSGTIYGQLRLMPTLPHTPRVTVDRMTLARETWRVPVGEVPAGGEPDEADRYRAFRRWATDLGLPRFVFLKVPGEIKPYYVDLTSPVLVNLALMALRGSRRAEPGGVVSISEMHPDPDHVWLPDHEGRRYTSEFRFTAVDRGDHVR
jgi:hypothetical protein